MIFKLPFFFLTILLTLNIITADAQGSRLNSLIQKGGQSLRNDSAESSLETFKKALKLAGEQDEIKKKAIILNNMGVAYYQIGQYKQGIEHYQLALTTYEKLGNDSLTGQSMHNLALAYKEIGSYDLAIKNLHQAITIFNSTGQKKDLASSYNSLGNVHALIKDNDKAISNYVQALTIRQDINFEKGIASSLHNIGKFHLETNDLNSAHKFLHKALIQKNLHSSNSSKASTYSQLGELYIKIDKIDSSEYFLEKALALRLESGNEAKIAKALLNLGKLTTIKKEFQQADSLYSEAIRLAEKTSSMSILEEALREYIKLLKTQEKYSQASTLQDRLISIKNEISGIEQKKEIARLEILHLVDEKENDLEVERNENVALQTKNWYWTIGFSVVATLLLIIIILSVNNRRKKKNIERQNSILTLKNQEIDLLHKELSHRTKNYFDMLKGVLILDRRSSKNEDLKKHLSDYIVRVEAMSQIQRYLLSDQESNNKVALQLYLENVISNLESMYNKNSSVEFTCKLIPIEIDYDIAMRLGLVVNELILNALEHGIKNIDNPRIDIDLKQLVNHISLTVKDNGKGMDISKTDSNSIGNQLVDLLLEKIHGEVTRTSTPGLTIEVKIPIKKP